jgi:magnesium chelatase family protein
VTIGRAHAISLLGLEGAVVEIEADISNNLPSFVLIGLPDAALGEARDRVRSAAGNSGVPLPSRKLTVNPRRLRCPNTDLASISG